MKCVTYNIQYGLGRDGRYDLDRTARAVEGADVIALQEVERFWKRSGDVDEVAGLAERLPDFHDCDPHSPTATVTSEKGRVPRTRCLSMVAR